MPGNDQPKRQPSHADAPGDAGLPQVSRRSLLGAAGVGAAGIAAGAFGGLAVAQAATGRPAAASKTTSAQHTVDAAAEPDDGEHVVVHVRDAHSGDLDVYRGTSLTRVHDPDLAARLRRVNR